MVVHFSAPTPEIGKSGNTRPALGVHPMAAAGGPPPPKTPKLAHHARELRWVSG